MPNAGPNISGTATLFRSRLIDHAGTGSAFQVFGYACDDSLVWCDESRVYESVYLGPDPVDGKPIWGYASECCEYPPELDMEFVEVANWPPFGISKHVRLIIRNTHGCPDLACIETILTYQGAGTGTHSGYWTGSLGGMDWTMRIDTAPLPDDPAVLRMSVTGCATASGMLMATTCVYPLRASEAGSFVAAACCNCTLGEIYFQVKGFCRRLRMGRLVDVGTGSGTVPRAIYAVGDCCAPCDAGESCCALYTPCDLVASFENPSGCLDGYVTPLPIDNAVPPWHWHKQILNSNLLGCPSNADSTWDVRLKCTTVGGGGCTLWTIRIENHETGCGCSAEVTINDDCKCLPLDLVFNITCFTAPMPPTFPLGCNESFTIRITR